MKLRLLDHWFSSVPLGMRGCAHPASTDIVVEFKKADDVWMIEFWSASASHQHHRPLPFFSLSIGTLLRLVFIFVVAIPHNFVLPLGW